MSPQFALRIIKPFLGLEKNISPNLHAAIINRKIETITAAGGLMAKKFYNKDMPMVDRLSEDPIKAIKTGDIVEVNGTTGEVTIYSR